MRILLTGSFGNIGKDVLRLLLHSGYRVRCFDIETERNRKVFESFSTHPWKARRIELSWGDIRNHADVLKAVEDIQAIIHLAAVIPPSSEKNPETAHAINVEGTRHLIRAAEALDPRPRFIFTSSVSVYGPRMSDPPPRTTDDPVRPTDNYSSHKVECEGMLRESMLPWTVLRVAAVSVADLNGSMDPILFEIPLDQRIEFVHSRDVARACVNSLSEDVVHRVLHVGGGIGSQMLQREFLRRILEATGVGMFPESAFFVPEKASDWFYTDYMDTQEAQALLHYQVYTFDDYLQELSRKLGARRAVVRFLGPALRLYFSTRSPYFRAYWKRRLLGKGKDAGSCLGG
jgi:nucleoside-diphosphate-sugar epimerase